MSLEKEFCLSFITMFSSLDQPWTARTGQQAEQPGQDNKQNSQDRTTSRTAGIRQLGQDSLERASGTEQIGQEDQNMAGRTGQLGQDSPREDSR
jgi:hypothetical protein